MTHYSLLNYYPIVQPGKVIVSEEPFGETAVLEGKKFFDMLKSSIERVQED